MFETSKLISLIFLYQLTLTLEKVLPILQKRSLFCFIYHCNFLSVFSHDLNSFQLSCYLQLFKKKNLKINCLRKICRVVYFQTVVEEYLLIHFWSLHEMHQRKQPFAPVSRLPIPDTGSSALNIFITIIHLPYITKDNNSQINNLTNNLLNFKSIQF